METLWNYLSQTQKPIVMYGMGDGAVKIMKVFEKYGIKPADFMASDEFVRGHSFMGYTVKKLSDIEAQYDDFIIIVCFGSSLPSVTDKLYALSQRHELYAPDVPVIGEGLFDEEYLVENQEKLSSVRSMLSDEISRDTFDKLVRFRLTGDISYLKACETPKSEAYELLKIGEKEVYVDLGAYTGDTVEEFLKITKNKFDSIYALEPDERNFLKMKKRLFGLGDKVFFPFNALVWNEDTTLDFYRRGGRNSSLNGTKGKAVPTQARSVDSVLEGKRATLIKFDVEGAEAQALEGSGKTISRYKPKLIVSVYHRNEDMLDLALKIKELNPSYKLYLRHHPYIPAWDTNLYCI